MTETEAIRALFDETGGFIWYAKESSEEPIVGVTEIDLGDADTFDGALEYLKYFPRLEWLCLEDAQISDYGLRHLAELANLKELVLSGTNVTEDGVAMLRKVLPTCKIEW